MKASKAVCFDCSSLIEGTEPKDSLEVLLKTDLVLSFLSVIGVLCTRGCFLEDLIVECWLKRVDCSNLEEETDRVVATDGTETLDSLELLIEKFLPPPADKTADAESRWESSSLISSLSNLS